MNKKQKIILGSSLSAVAILGAVGTTLGIVLTKNNNTPFDPTTQVMVTYDAGTGSFESNSSTTKVVNKNTKFESIPAPVVAKNNATFAGWSTNGTESGLLNPYVTINESIKLTAIYSDEIAGESVKVTFAKKTEDQKPIISGNTTVAIKKGKQFFMLNRPAATKDNCIFAYWATRSGTEGTYTYTEYKGNQKITSNITLYPEFYETKQINFQTTGKGDGSSSVTATYSGNATPYYQLTSKWGDVNKPVATSGALYFQYYCSDADCKNQISDTATIASLSLTDGKVYPKFTAAPSELYSILNFTTKGATESGSPVTYTQKDVTYSGNTSPAVLFEQQWSGINKPVATCADFKVSKWQYATGTAEPEVTGTWTDITDTTTFPKSTLKYWVRPILVPAVTDVYVYSADGESKVLPSNTYTYNAYVLGGAKQEVTYKLYYKDKTHTEWTEDTDKTYGTLSIYEATEAAVTLTTKDYASTDAVTLKVEATSTVDTDKKGYLDAIQLTLPYVDSYDVWYHVTDDAWYSLKMDELCDPAVTTLNVKKVEGSTSTVARTALNQNLILGDQITKVNKNFLYDCTAFEGTIDLNKATTIDDSFMEGCTKFNNTITNLSKVTSIGASFLSGCTTFNKALDLTACKTVGDDFLYGCSVFNNGWTTGDLTTFTMPAMVTIGGSFMNFCTAFKQNITIPSTVTKVADFFMTNCDGFTGTITINCNVEGVFTRNDHDISADTETAAIRATGYKVAGDGAAKFREYYPDTKDDVNYIYRLSTAA